MKENIINSLKVLQASLQVFYQKLNNFHWNVKGLEFFEVHKQTEKLADEIHDLVDRVAEKIVMNESVALGSFQEILKYSKINEIKSKDFGYLEVAKNIKNDLTVIIELSDNVGTGSVIQPLLDEIYMLCDKYRWQFGAFSRS